MSQHGSSPRSHSAAAGRQSLTCTCSEFPNSFAELCPVCVAAYDQWLQENEAEVREETIRLSPAQLFAALELFNDATQPEFVLSLRTRFSAVERAA